MEGAVVVVFMLLAAMVRSGFSTGPAFLWSQHYDVLSNGELKELVNYQTISPKELAKSVLSDGGWSNLLCLEKKNQQPVDVALVFVGRELQSLDISTDKRADAALLDLLKVSFTRSNFSMAFPYVAATEEETMEASLLSSFKETCGQELEAGSVALLGSCSIDADNFHKLSDLHSLQDHLASRKEKRLEGKADLVMFCHEGLALSHESDMPSSESETFSELLQSMDKSGKKFAVLYVSHPYRPLQYPYLRELERFLAEGAAGNASSNSTCDGVCQIKSSLLEGVLVGLVLLIILISGLCCMMGIQTPTRFEAPQES